MAKPISGVDGNATIDGEVLEVRGWTLSDTSDNQSYNSSKTKGQMRRVKGVQDWTGSITIYFDEGVRPAVSKGDILPLVLITAEGVSGKGEVGTGQGIVDSIDPEVDVEGGGLIGATLNMSADGAMVFAAQP